MMTQDMPIKSKKIQDITNDLTTKLNTGKTRSKWASIPVKQSCKPEEELNSIDSGVSERCDAVFSAFLGIYTSRWKSCLNSSEQANVEIRLQWMSVLSDFSLETIDAAIQLMYKSDKYQDFPPSTIAFYHLLKLAEANAKPLKAIDVPKASYTNKSKADRDWINQHIIKSK